MTSEDMFQILVAKLTFTINLKVTFFVVEMYSIYYKDKKYKRNHVSPSNRSLKKLWDIFIGLFNFLSFFFLIITQNLYQL